VKEKLLRLVNDRKERIIGSEVSIEAAIFICMCKIKGVDYFILEKRSPNIRQGGEISFPGGKVEKTDEDPQETALRETSEELGIALDKIDIYGKYGVVLNPLGLIIHCYFGYINIEKLEELNPQISEIERLIIVPFEYFWKTIPLIEEIAVENIPNSNIKNMDIPSKYRNPWRVASRKIYFYNYKNDVIWGITGGIIYDFISSLKKL